VRLARYQSALDGAEHVGVITGQLITPLGPGDGLVGQSLLLATAVARSSVPHPVGDPERLDGVRLLAPIPEPPSIRDFYAFETHVATARHSRGLEMAADWYELPVFYFTNPAAVLGPGDVLIPPPDTAELDYELEVAAVIGIECHDVVADAWLDVVAGFTVMNDWSARDLQKMEMAVGLGAAKGKDFSTSLGPVLVTPDELGALRLAMVARVNGEERSRGDLGEIHWPWEELAAHAARNTRLVAGDVLGSGTVGTGCILEHGDGRWLRPGDVVELEIEGIGVLRNVVGGA